jgi:hypothetical protein
MPNKFGRVTIPNYGRYVKAQNRVAASQNKQKRTRFDITVEIEVRYFFCVPLFPVLQSVYEFESGPDVVDGSDLYVDQAVCQPDAHHCVFPEVGGKLG